MDEARFGGRIRLVFDDSTVKILGGVKRDSIFTRNAIVFGTGRTAIRAVLTSSTITGTLKS